MLSKQLIRKGDSHYAIQFSADDVWSFVDEILRRELLYEYDMDNPSYIIISGQSGRKTILMHGWWLVFYENLVEALDNEAIWYNYEER